MYIFIILTTYTHRKGDKACKRIKVNMYRGNHFPEIRQKGAMTEIINFIFLRQSSEKT